MIADRLETAAGSIDFDLEMIVANGLRLLIAEAWVLGQVKSTGAAPKDLSRLPQELTTDPYSGAPFPYAADGADYHLYSVGADLKDDGGDTDETYSQPDLKLEKGS